MPFNVNDIRAQLTGGGARPNLFEVVLAFPAIAIPGAASSKMTFQCKAAQLPGSTLGMIEVPYFGRKIKIAGDRTFEEWTTTVIQDEDMIIYDACLRWSNSINTHETNFREAGNSPRDYQSSADVIHYGKAGAEIKRVNIVNMWPSVVAPIELGWETNDQIEEFQVTWQYDYWTSNQVTS